MSIVWSRRARSSAVGIGAVIATVVAGVAVAGALADDGRRAAVAFEVRGEADLAMVAALGGDIWNESAVAGEPIVVALPARALAVLRAAGIGYSIVVEDLDAAAGAERARLAHRAQTADWFADYRDLAEVTSHLETLASEHAGLATVRSIGTSIEGREIRAIEVSRGGPLRIALDGAQHAREWIAVMVPTCLAERLVHGDATDPRGGNRLRPSGAWRRARGAGRRLEDGRDPRSRQVDVTASRRSRPARRRSAPATRGRARRALLRRGRGRARSRRDSRCPRWS